MNALPRIDYADHPAYGGMLRPNPALGQAALEILAPHLEEARRVEEERTARFDGRYRAADPLSAELAQAGAAVRQLEGRAIDRIELAARPLIEQVRERLQATRAAGEPIKFRTALAPASPDLLPELWSAIRSAMADMGVLAAAAALYGAPGAKVRAASVLVNQPGQDWVSRLFRDLDSEPPPTVGMHIDSDGKCFVKSVLYLDDVGPKQGPFSIVPGSHLWAPTGEDRIFRRAFDKSELVVRSRKKRRMFVSLPEAMQVKAEFGGDMPPGSPEAEALLAQERVATGPRGQLNLFNPEAVHRGGNVRAGERRVLLITCGPSW